MAEEEVKIIGARTKAWIKLGAGIAVIVVAAIYIRKRIRAKKALREFGDIGTITNNSKGNSGGFTMPTERQDGWSPQLSAQKLYEAMKGWGTDENKIHTTLSALDCEQRKLVREWFNVYKGEGDTLDEWFAGDLSGSHLARARQAFIDCNL